jgi:hypothetical protein
MKLADVPSATVTVTQVSDSNGQIESTSPTITADAP